MNADRPSAVRRVLLAEAGANVVAVAAKVAVGLGTGSLALLSDALHSAADLANNALAWMTMRIAERPPDEDHPYGHAKFETLAVFVLGTLMGVLALEILLGVFRRDTSAEISTTGTALVVVVATLFLQLGVALWQGHRARELRSEILRADAQHTLVDSATTLLALVGWQLGARGMPWLDSTLAVGLAALVVTLAFQLFRRAIPVLVDGAAVHPNELQAAASRVQGVRGVGRARSRWDGQRRVADVVVRVDPSLDTVGAHKIADAVEQQLARELAIEDAVVHVEPASSRSLSS